MGIYDYHVNIAIPINGIYIAIPIKKHYRSFFPRASERRVLLIVGVCKTSSHLHIF